MSILEEWNGIYSEYITKVSETFLGAFHCLSGLLLLGSAPGRANKPEKSRFIPNLQPTPKIYVNYLLDARIR
jgi:hypothetical protein